MITTSLQDRCEGLCELCTQENASIAYAVSPKNSDRIEHEVAICTVCAKEIQTASNLEHWQCLAGSIWNTEASVQVLSHRILHGIREKTWANEILESVELDESVLNWSLSAFEQKQVHVDSNGTELLHGDTVVLTQGLNVKGANFMAPKGTIVRKIRLVSDNPEQIEGKVNDQTIIILTKYVRKSS
jgi:protein PhnA